MIEKLLTWLSRYDLDSVTFDLTGVCVVVVFRQYVTGGGILAGAFTPLAAAALVDAAFLLIAFRMNRLFRRAGEDPSGFSGLVLSGAYALMTIAQPVVVTAMMRRFGVLPDEPFMLVSFFVGNAVIFPALLVWDTEDRKELYRYILIAFAAGFLFFGGLDIHPTPESRAVLCLSLVIISAFLLLQHPAVALRIRELLRRFIAPVREHYIARLSAAAASSFLLWSWWELAADSITMADPGMTIGGRLAVLYFTGPLLYRISLMVMPPLRPFAVIPGIMVLIASLVV